MPWYSLSRPSGNNTFTIYSYSPGIPFPYKYENIIFDESNPNRIAFGAYSGGSGYINSILIPPSTTSSKYNNVFKAVDSNSFIQSAPCGIFFLKNEANAYVEPVIFDKIRGKFKLKYSIENFRHIENNIGTAFKINCNVNGVSYTNMCISSSPDWKIFSRSNPTYSTNTKFLYFYNDLPVLTGDDNFTNINKPKDLLIINLKESNNVIIDFGDYEQDIPSIMLEDFVINAEIIYDNIYTIKSTTGSTLTTLTEAPPMTSATLSAVGNAKYLTLKGENNTNYAMEWTSETPQGKIFAGLATSKGGSIVIPVGETSTINLTESTDLYEVWQTYRPPTTTFDINLYKNSAEPNKVDKTAELSTVGTISGVLRQECSLIGPEIIIQYDKPPDFNYCYIANFGRYYYVENIVSMRQNLWRVRLRCDVLMTYKTQILNLNARIARQQYIYSYRQIDSEIPFTNDPEITVTDIPNSLNLGKPNYENILLTVVDNGT